MLYSLFAYDNSGEPCLPPLLHLPLLHSLHLLQVAILSSVLHYFSSVYVLHSSVTLSSRSPSYHSLQCLALFPISPCPPLLHTLHVLRVTIHSSGFHLFPLSLYLPLLHSLHVLQVAFLSSGFHYFPSVHVLHCYILFMFCELPFSPVASRLPLSPVAFIISHRTMASAVTFSACS